MDADHHQEPCGGCGSPVFCPCGSGYHPRLTAQGWGCASCNWSQKEPMPDQTPWFVQSEHVRGEQRFYWVEAHNSASDEQRKALKALGDTGGAGTTGKKRAQRMLDALKRKQAEASETQLPKSEPK